MSLLDVTTLLGLFQTGQRAPNTMTKMRLRALKPWVDKQIDTHGATERTIAYTPLIPTPPAPLGMRRIDHTFCFRSNTKERTPLYGRSISFHLHRFRHVPFFGTRVALSCKMLSCLVLVASKIDSCGGSLVHEQRNKWRHSMSMLVVYMGLVQTQTKTWQTLSSQFSLTDLSLSLSHTHIYIYTPSVCWHILCSGTTHQQQSPTAATVTDYPPWVLYNDERAKK